MNAPAPDSLEIKRALSTLHPEGIIELRAIHRGGRKRIDAGCFDSAHRELLVGEAVKLNAEGAAVYCNLNELDPQLLSRYANRIEQWVQATATDNNVKRRRWLLIDIDPQRPKDTSATATQLDLAIKLAGAVLQYLTKCGWPKPVSADSGNGLHFLYRIDLPNDKASTDLVKGCLGALAARFDDEAVKIDCSVHNAARIVKLHGTVSRKGDNIVDAPWRLSKLRVVPDPIMPVSLEQLQTLAAEVEAPKPKTNGSSGVHFDSAMSWTETEVGAFLTKGGIEYDGPDSHEGAQRWKLKRCPFNADHGFNESAVFLQPNGRLGFKCLHNGCKDRHWQDLRTLVDGEREQRRGFGSFGSDGGTSFEDPWGQPEPLTDALPAIEQFPAELLPEALRPWVIDVAERTQAPIEYVAVSAVVSLGAVLGRKIALRPKRLDDWYEYANLWGAVVGPPSWMKSPALDEGKRPSTIIETGLLKTFDETHQGWVADAEAAKVKRDGAKDRARKAAAKGEDFDKTSLVADVIPEEPKAPRLIVNNATVPALCEVLRANQNGVLVYRDELSGLIAELDQDGMEGSRGFYLTGWSGKEGYVEDRIGRGTNLRVPAVCLSLLGGIQPSRVAPLLKETLSTGGGDGFLARFSLIVWPDSPGEYRAIDREPNRRARESAQNVYQRLQSLDPATVGAETVDGIAPFLRLDAGAAEVFTAWDVELRNRLRSGLDDGALSAHLGKYPKMVCALALLDHLASGATGDIGASSVLSALTWSELLESHARRLYASLGQAHVDAARSLLNRIKRGDLTSPFKLRSIYRRGWAHLADYDAARAAADLLESKGYLRIVDIQGGEAGGRPTAEYHVNPLIVTK